MVGAWKIVSMTSNRDNSQRKTETTERRTDRQAGRQRERERERERRGGVLFQSKQQ